ncbi:MAG: 3'-5' exoribonuclease [Candidatus Brocadiales bacterium]|nr:3'-5' exoribonuclease [Candidatus Bathyanammoxibius sp.]
MKCVAIDFETANSKRLSVCAMGVAVVEEQKIVERASWLIRPPELYFDPYNTYIHGITESDVADKPEFNELWGDIRQYFQGGLLIAHNASFDISVLRHVLDEYDIAYPSFRYLCTRAIAKRAWPRLLSYSLDTVSDHLGITFKHHDAEEDAVACAEVALRACSQLGVGAIEDAAEKIEVACGQLSPGAYKPSGVKRPSLTPGDIVPTTNEFDPDHPFFERTVVFTGTLQSMVRKDAMQKVVNCGGRCAESVGSSTNYLVLGDQDFARRRDGHKSGKLRAAESLILAGADLEIVPEAEFLRILAE